MDYIKVEIAIEPLEPYRDILCAMLAEAGYESFEYTGNGVLAYIEKKKFDESFLLELEWPIEKVPSISWQSKEIPVENWNEEWESQFPPVEISDRLRIRAPFHEKLNEHDFELEIMPQMSFGTGHHPTTSLLAKRLLNIDVTDKDVLDMGAGTGLLGILAEKLGARSVLAIDIEEWAVDNAIENAQRNDCSRFEAILGDADQLEGRDFDIILANINRNVLTAEMNRLSNSLRRGGGILFSGFYVKDIETIRGFAEKFGLVFDTSGSKEDWAFVHCTKA